MTAFKGLDDLLAAGKRPRRLKGEAVRDFFASTGAKLFGTASEPVETTVAPDNLLPRPPFPVDVFPASVAQFAHRVAAAMGCPIDFPGMAILVISGAAIGAARALEVKKGWDEKPGIYGVIVNKPGSAKTPALAAVMAPICEEQDRLYEEYKDALRAYESQLEQYKKDKGKRDDHEPEPEPPIPPLLRHLFANDTTVEGLAANLAENPKGILLFRDELTAWVRGMDQYKGRGTDRQFFLSCWSGEMAKVDRKGAHGKPLIMRHPFVAVLGGVQPDLLLELDGMGGKEDGFVHRILFAYPEEVPVQGWSEAELDESDRQDWSRILQRLLNLQLDRHDEYSERPRRLRFSPEGKMAFATWCNDHAAEQHHEDFPQQLSGPWSKLKSYCARFALIIHLLRVACGEAGDAQDEGQVDDRDVACAVRLVNYFKCHYRAAFTRMQLTLEDVKVQSLINWMKKKGMKCCTARDITRAEVASITKASEAEQTIRAAVDRGLGSDEDPAEASVTSRRKGRSKRFFLKG